MTIDVSGLGNIRENGGLDTYSVKLNSEPISNVVVRVLNRSPGVATVSPKSLTFTPINWDLPRTVTVAGVNDNVDNGSSRSATIYHDVSGMNEYNNITDNDVTVMVTVIDDDDAGLTVTPTFLPISRGQTDTFTVKLDTEPDGAVRVTALSGDSEGLPP